MRLCNQRLIQNGCTLDELVSAEIPHRQRDPLVVKRELPCFGLNSGVRKSKKSTDVSVQSITTTRPSTQVSEDEERFQAYQRAARRNLIFSRASNRYQLTTSPLCESVVETSAYPEAELTPELRRKQGAIQAYKSLRKFDVKSPTPVMYRERSSRSTQGARRPHYPDTVDKQLEAIHRNLDCAYRNSLPKVCSFISSHSEFLRKSTSPVYDRPTRTSYNRNKPRSKPSNDQTLSGDEILTILNCYKEEQQASRLMMEEERKQEVSGKVSRIEETRRERGPVCRVVELTGVEAKSASNFHRPKTLLERPNFSRFKLPQKTGGLCIEVQSGFMQIQPAALSPKPRLSP